MDQKLDTLEKKGLVEIVKFVQKRRMHGTAGGWKDFLNSYDKKFGSSISDPARRSNEVLVSFLKTFTKEDDWNFIAKVMQSHLNRDVLEQFKKISPGAESPEQRLVRLTLEHPQYPLCYIFPSCDEGWVVTKLGKISKVMRSNTMYAVDCEMVLCEDGSEGLVRVCVVDRNLEVKLDELVKPEKAVTDYRSEITGVTAEDLVGATYSLRDIQFVLGYEVRKEGTPHNCLDDACAAMKLVLTIIERGVDNAIQLVHEDVLETERAKLMLHRIPTDVLSEELYRVIPGDFTIEVKPLKKGQGDNYSAFAIFCNPEEANQAFENVKGNQDKDSYGRPQKLVEFQSSAGKIASFYVRKMACDEPPNQIFVKRAFQGQENSGESKKIKTGQINQEKTMADLNLCICEDHLKEIEKLKVELREKDFQISMQDKIISDLKKRVKELKKGKKNKAN